MPHGSAVLVFVAGPQRGTSASVIGPAAVAGRSDRADIQLNESYISRRHMRFELTPDGWVVENLSSNGTIVNGKRYKTGKRILLETGDVLAAGSETQMLFVSGDDDPAEALAAYRERAGEHELPAAVPEPEPVPEEAAAPHQRAEMPKPPRPPSPIAAERPSYRRDARQVKRKKYVIFACVYAAVLVLVVLLLMRLKDGGRDGSARVPRLTDRQIAEAIGAPLTKQRDPTKATEALDEATRLYPSRHFDTGSLYKCLKSFKLHLAYRGGPFDNVEHERMFQRTSDELIELIRQEYRNAYAYERNREYENAKRMYDKLLKDLPEPQRDDPVHSVIVANVMARANLVDRMMGGR